MYVNTKNILTTIPLMYFYIFYTIVPTTTYKNTYLRITLEPHNILKIYIIAFIISPDNIVVNPSIYNLRIYVYKYTFTKNNKILQVDTFFNVVVCVCVHISKLFTF